MPSIINMEALFADLRELLGKHGWESSEAYDLAQEILRKIVIEGM